MKISIKTALLLPLFICLNNFVYSQCCSAGNPISTDGNSGNIIKNSLNIYLMYKNSGSDTYYKGSEKTDYTYMESYFHFTSLSLEYGLNGKIALMGNIGYFLRKGQLFPDFNNYEKFAKGFGDAAFTLKYNFLNIPKYKMSFTALATIKLPVGAKNVEFEGVILPLDFQPSTGSMRYNPGISVSKIFNERYSIYAFGSYEFIDEIKTASATYKYGDIIVGMLGTNIKINQSFSFGLQGRYEWRGKRVDNGYQTIESTGGEIFYLVPQLNYSVKKGTSFSVSYDQPTYRYMNYFDAGNGQLGNKRMITVKASLGINQLVAPESMTIDEIKTLNTTEIFVDGLCEMCKTRIEDITLKEKGVKFAVWNPKTKILLVKYKETPDIDKLQKDLAKAGHDNDKYKASDKAYSKLHECCKYRAEIK